MDIFTRFTHEKTTQNNFSRQNFSVENNYFSLFFRYGGTIYAFLFSSDIVNNLMVAALSKEIKQEFGYLGLFLIISAWGLVALLATALYPQNPSPKSNKLKLTENGVITMNGESKSFFKRNFKEIRAK